MARSRTSCDELADRLLAWLEANNVRGRNRAQKQRDVAKMLNTTTRNLQEAAIVLNDRGVAVVSSCAAPMGIYLAETVAEVAEYAGQLDGRLRALAARLKPVRRIMQDRGQRRLF